ncbi:MAG: aminotransferase class V-fold PLP-dependent enzyme [Patescibacteria group bacterium]|nr:aminotransferase class V-fold PLP-dependent enzyme [Patescibacteria group bacterium]
MNKYYEEYSVCGERSLHKLGKMVSDKVHETRSLVARLIDARKEEIVFTRNTTESINFVAYSIDWKKGDVVLTSDKEHNSNLLPWIRLSAKLGTVHAVVKSDSNGSIDLLYLKELLEKYNGKVKLVAVTLSSNLDGITNPVLEIARLGHRYGALILVDAAQGLPHQSVSVKKFDVDFLAFSGHKMLGPSGTGVLYGKKKLLEEFEPFMIGGGTVVKSTYNSYCLENIPERFEAGLQDYAGIIGLGEAVKFIQKVGYKEIARRDLELNKYITDYLCSIERVHIIGANEPEKRGGIISFYVDGADSHMIALMLDEANIMVRSGQLCVHSWFSDKDIQGAIRVSAYFYNTLEEAEYFTKTLSNILKAV